MIARRIDEAVEDPARYGRFSDGKMETFIPTIPGRWRTYYENIRDVLTGGTEPLVKLAEVRRAIAVLDAAFQSAREHSVVEVEVPAIAH
ncbi:MAG: hypothetical protein BWY76_03207 [bacterium ADurb.Bin429]|nr:MAG: hypothetical protein BWY76_03207 [bacterium ADurb.Bin429]